VKTQTREMGQIAWPVRIPKSVAEAAKLRPGDLLEAGRRGLGK